MKQHLIGFLIATLIFAVGLRVDKACHKYQRQFSILTISCGTVGSGENRSEESDGIIVYTDVDPYGSTALANKELDKNLQNASKIIEITYKHNEAGEIIGRRVVGIFKEAEHIESMAFVMWTDGSRLYTLRSPLLKHILS